MDVMFFDVKTRQKVSVPENMLRKVKYERKLSDGSTQVRYALRGKTTDGRNLTKFVSQADWDKLNVPTE
jgi:hypothetical protein